MAEGRLPVEFDWLSYTPAPWTVADSIAVWKQRWWTLTGRLENLALGEAARRHLPPDLLSACMSTELGEETIVPGDAGATGTVPGGADTGEGSNNWAVHGSPHQHRPPRPVQRPPQPVRAARAVVPGPADPRGRVA